MDKQSERQKYLIAKYSSIYLGFSIPNDIIILLQLFCKDGLVWTFHADKLQAFLESKRGEKIISPVFVQNKIAFECVLCRNPTQGINVGYVQFSLKVHKWDPSISTVSCYYELKCLQTKSEWKNSVKFASIWDSTSWNNRTLSNVTLKQMKPKHRLDFICLVDIIHTTYKNKCNKIDENYIFIENHCKYKWTIDKILLDHFRMNCDNKRQVFFSKNFNSDCFCISIKPKISIGLTSAKCKIGIQLLKLPLFLKKLKAKITIKVTKNNYTFNKGLFKQSEVVTFHIYGNTTFYFNAFHGEKNINNALISLKDNIIAEINILDIWDTEYVRVEHAKWNTYGIIESDNKKKTSIIASLFQFK
eukprot:45383_1